MDRIISPLYPEEGAPLLGFCCRVLVERINRHNSTIEKVECRSLMKTEDGAWKHALLAHGIEREPTLETKANEKTNPKIDQNRA